MATNSKGDTKKGFDPIAYMRSLRTKKTDVTQMPGVNAKTASYGKVKAATKNTKKSGKKVARPVVTDYTKEGYGFLKIRRPGQPTLMKAVKATKQVKADRKPSKKMRAQAAKAKRCN